MKIILTAVVLLVALSSFAEKKTQTDSSQTNSAAVTNTPAQADARTGATHKWKQKVSP